MVMIRNRMFGCLAMLGSMVLVGSSSATDGIKNLILVTQLKADLVNDPPPPPPPPPPKTIVGHYWEGSMQSDGNGYLSGIRIGVNSESLTYIEQESLFAYEIHRAVDPDGHLWLIGYDPVQKVYIMVSARAVDWSATGEATAMEGDYQIYQLDSRGRMRVLDQGSLGIIAILIGL